jgi:hypothetical protein
MAQVHAWERWEASLTSSNAYANPYADVELRAEFVGPAGQTISGFGFWDGERTSRILCAFPDVGTWTWRTICTDATNAGLHNQRGSVEVRAYTGTNALYRHGLLKVSENARYLVHRDGTPFLWVGDTPWAAFIAATQPEWESYVQDRKAKKFTVLQLHCGDGFLPRDRDRNGNLPFAGSGTSLQWNPEYWRGVEMKVQYANEQGIVACACAVRQPARSPLFPCEDPAQVRLFARNLAARLMGNFVVYSPVADDLWTSQADECGESLRAATRLHLITAHPRFFLDPAKTFHEKGYIDFAGIQTGAGWIGDPYNGEKGTPFDGRLACQNAIEWPQMLRRMTPRKPVLNLEAVYDARTLQEADPNYFSPPYPPRLARSTAWLSFLSGAMGYTYGCFGVWNWGMPVTWLGPMWDFQTAVSQPSARHIAYFAEFLAGIDWWRLEPRHDLIKNQVADWLHKMALSTTPSGDLAVAYLPDNPNITLDMSSFAGFMTVKWFNPVTNIWQTEPAPVANAGFHTFVKPADWSDAALVLSKRD